MFLEANEAENDPCDPDVKYCDASIRYFPLKMQMFLSVSSVSCDESILVLVRMSL